MNHYNGICLEQIQTTPKLKVQMHQNLLCLNQQQKIKNLPLNEN